jgi:hypothetical protein
MLPCLLALLLRGHTIKKGGTEDKSMCPSCKSQREPQIRWQRTRTEDKKNGGIIFAKFLSRSVGLTCLDCDFQYIQYYKSCSRDSGESGDVVVGNNRLSIVPSK